MIVAFIGAVILIMGNPNDSIGAQDSTLFGFISLLLNPVLVAIGTIMMRSMRELNESVVSCYMNGASILVFTPLVYLQGADLSPCFSFTLADWCWIVGLSLSVIGSQTFRYKALQH